MSTPPDPSLQPGRGTPSRSTKFLRARGLPPQVIAAGIIAIVLIGAVAILTAIISSRRVTNAAFTSTTADVSRDPAAVATPFVLPSDRPTSLPTPAPRFPFGDPNATPAPNGWGTPAPRATLAPQPSPAPHAPYYPPPPPRQPAPAPATPRRATTVAQLPGAHSSALNFGGSADDVPALDSSAPRSPNAGPDTPTPTPTPASAAFAGDDGARASAFRDRAASTSFAAASDDATHYAPPPQQAAQPVGYVRRASRMQLNVATIITLRAQLKIDSQIPGPFIGRVTDCVYDSASHDNCVVPPGTMVYGEYNSGVVVGQNRLLTVAARFVFADGRQFLIGAQPVADAQGAAGLTGDVDAHHNRILGPALLLTALGAAEAAIAPQTGGTLTTSPSVGDQARTAAGQQINAVANELILRNVQRGPSIIVRPPDRFQIIVNRDLPLDAYEVPR